MSVKWFGPQMEAKVRRGMMKGVVIGIGIVEARALYLITQTKKNGRLYRRRGRLHRASAPGQPFASDTGNTVQQRTIELDAGRLRATLIFRSKTAVWMEFGTRRVKPRPYARRALAETASQVRDAVLGEVQSELRRP